MFAHQVCAWSPKMPEEVVGSPETVVIDSHELSIMWGLGLGP